MLISSLTETIIRDRASAKIFQRGEQYYRSGAVTNICSRGNTIQATVEGNEVELYTELLLLVEFNKPQRLRGR